MNQTISLCKEKVSINKQAFYAVFGVFLSVALPQLFHLCGIVTGTGALLGRVFLPMHLPVIFLGLFAGPVAGALTGLFGPLVSFVLTGMPMAKVLPFMMAELFGYGLCAGLLRNIRLPNILKVVITIFAGRAVRMLFCVVMIYGFANTSETVFSYWTKMLQAWPGLLLQLSLIPLVLYKMENNE